jgi:hypothetical protein
MATYDTLKGEVVFAGREPLTNAQKDAIFDDIDTDKNGTLDLHEFSVYIQGKYSITLDTARQVFKFNDLDGNNTCPSTKQNLEHFWVKSMLFILKWKDKRHPSSKTRLLRC